MTLSRSAERSVLGNELLELVDRTHHPAIYGADIDALRDIRKRLREERGKLRTHVRQRQREARGKSEERGKSFPGSTDQPLKRKQAISTALKRVNKELARVERLEARTAHVEAARRALKLHRSSKFHPDRATDQTANAGMQPQPSTKRRRVIPGSQVGSVSQATKNAQARKDNRGKS